VDGDPLTVQIVDLPQQLVALGSNAFVVRPLGRLYQAVKARGESSPAQIQEVGEVADWGVVHDKNGRVRFVPERDTQGRPYGGTSGVLRFRVSDGFAESDNLGLVNVAVNSAPTATGSATSIPEGDAVTVTLRAEDQADCPSGFCGRLSDGTYTGQMRAIISVGLGEFRVDSQKDKFGL